MQDFNIILSEPDADGIVTIHDGLDGPAIATANDMEQAQAYARGLVDGFTYARRLIGSAYIRPIQLARFSAEMEARQAEQREAKRKARVTETPPPAA